MSDPQDHLPEPSEEDLQRSERLASMRLTRATWALAAAAIVLALATIGLIVATRTNG